MRRCILHVGMPKTGSSSIQASLKHFASKNFRYARLLKTPNHSGAITYTFSTPENSQWKSKKKPSRSQKDISELVKKRLKKQLRRTKADTLIISGEGISTLRLKELKELKNFISRYVDSIEIVAYIRSPKSYMESWFQQLVKANVEREIRTSDFVRASGFDISLSYPHYRKRFEKFDQVFGVSNVQYWPFLPKHFPEKCVVRDFCARIGIRDDIDVQRVNEGLSRSATAALFSYRKFYSYLPERSHFNRENKLLVKKMSGLPGDKLRFSSTLVKPLLDEHQNDIRWMESRLQSPLTEDIFRHDDCAVTTEEDLLSFDRSTLDWLIEQTGAARCESAQTRPEQVAELVHQLQTMLVERATRLGLVTHRELEKII